MSDTSQGTTSDTVKRAIAKHELIDAQGEVVENEEQAHGIRYTQLATGKVVNYVPTGDAQRMFAVFGAKTMATNEASQVRNNPKGAGTDEEQIEAITDRFTLVDSGTWIDRTRDGVGAQVDKDKLAAAIVEVLVADGKVPQDQADVFTGKVRAKLEADKGYQATARKVPGVDAAYARHMGRQTKTTDDLLNI